MPISSFSSANSIMKPGVCTSTTRPASPYDGQVIYETDTDRVAVYDSSAWVYKTNAGAPAMAVVQPETTVSSALTITLDGCFTSVYTNYRLHMNITGATTNNPVIQLRSGGTTASGTNYWRQYVDASNATFSANRTSGTSLDIGYADDNLRSSFIVEIFQPQLAQYTSFFGQNMYTSGASTTNLLWYQINGIHNLATSYDGFIITCGSAMTGTYSLYGYSK